LRGSSWAKPAATGSTDDACFLNHAGDMGNLDADATGQAHLEIAIAGITLMGKDPIVGRAVIVHAGEDNGGQPTGNAGARVGQAVIGVANPAAK
jgi:Cu-Zn family superoxide dismutase